MSVATARSAADDDVAASPIVAAICAAVAAVACIGLSAVVVYERKGKPLFANVHLLEDAGHGPAAA